MLWVSTFAEDFYKVAKNYLKFHVVFSNQSQLLYNLCVMIHLVHLGHDANR